jgi:hypothetical protein
MYLLRMVEALAALLGHARFHALVAAYVTAHPSRSYTLNRLGDALPDDLAARARHPREHALADLARLEHAIGTAFDAAPAERLDAAALAEASAGGWEALRLQPQPGLRLVRTRTDPGVALDALRAGERVRTPPRRWTHTVVFRVGDDAARAPRAVSPRAVVRPDSLLEGEVSTFSTRENLVCSPFAPRPSRRANVAHFLCGPSGPSWSTPKRRRRRSKRAPPLGTARDRSIVARTLLSPA